MARRPFSLQLIPEFERATSDEPIAEWLEWVEMICELSVEGRVKRIFPLKLTCGALIVYRQLTKEQRADIEEIKCSLTTMFTVCVFVAFDQYMMWWFHNEETVDKFLAALKRLALQDGEMLPKKWIACAFVVGLPQHVRQQLRASVWMNTMTLYQLRSSGRAILVENHNPADPIVTAVQHLHTDAVEQTADQNGGNLVCYPCTNHLGNGCIQGRATRTNNWVRCLCQRLWCFRCQRMGHFAPVSKKRLRRKDASASLPRQANIEALPLIELLADGWRCTALVDIGCSKTLMYKSECRL